MFIENVGSAGWRCPVWYMGRDSRCDRVVSMKTWGWSKDHSKEAHIINTDKPPVARVKNNFPQISMPNNCSSHSIEPHTFAYYCEIGSFLSMADFLKCNRPKQCTNKKTSLPTGFSFFQHSFIVILQDLCQHLVKQKVKTQESNTRFRNRKA